MGGSGKMKHLELNHQFIEDHIEELIKLEDYVPFSFADYGVQDKRDEFLKSKNLLTTIQEMDALIKKKCEYYDDSIKAYNGVLIEWINYHDEFKGIIDINFNIKNNDEFIKFIDLLYDVELPSEKKVRVRPQNKGLLIRDDSSIQLPNFKKMDEIFEKYPNKLLADYLAYLV